MKFIVALTAAALLTAPAISANCRDAKGKFTKCPTSGVAVATAGGKISAPDSKGKCRVVIPAPGTKQKKGQFVTCPK